MQTSTAPPPNPARANGRSLRGRSQTQNSLDHSGTGIHAVQTQRERHPHVHETSLQLIVLLGQSLGRLERRLAGRVSQNTLSTIRHAIELMRQLDHLNT